MLKSGLPPCKNRPGKYILKGMRKPVFPRILLLLLLYCGVFVVLVSMQFAKQGGFTRRVGNFVVSGQYRSPGENDPPRSPNEYFLDGDVHVFFGGIDFGMVKGDSDHSFTLINIDETEEEILPERMIISGDSSYLFFPGEIKLEFSTQYSGGALELVISGVFSEEIIGADLPFKPLRKSQIKDMGDGQLLVSSDGFNYSFGSSPMDSERRVLRIRADEAPVSYRVIPERRNFIPADFVLPQGSTKEAYNEFLTRWRDQNFSYWNRTIPEQNNEDVVIAYGAEALVRGTYKAAMAAVSPAFLRGQSRTYESSVYLGNLDQAYRSLVSREREKIARLSRLINEKSLDFLKESHVFEYFAVRGHNNFVEAGADLIRAIDPAILALDITPGILEGFVDWKKFRPNTENPFERLVDQACFVVSGSLQKTPGPGLEARVFSFSGDQGETEFNLRLGKALLVYADLVKDDPLAGIGRSLIVSALSMGGATGAVKAGLVFTGTGEIKESSDSSELTSARLYRILSPLDSFPAALPVSISPNSIWTWTAAQTVSSTQQNDVMDITVKFPAQETHYMIIRGMRPFVRLQLYGMDFRSDPQFERYDSSGWVYYSQEQVLVVKMKHRTAEEHIRIIFREAAGTAAPAPQPPAAPAAANAAASGGAANGGADETAEQ